jgi:alpha-glucosidase
VLTRFTERDQFRQMFAFDLMLSPWDKQMIEQAMAAPLGVLATTGVAPAWAINNHDAQRIVTRLGRADAHRPERWTNSSLDVSAAEVDFTVGTRRARAAAALAFALPGALYLYQGEELGLPEVLDMPDERREDPIFALTEGAVIGRDGCRVPLPWADYASTSYGFSTPAARATVGSPGEHDPAVVDTIAEPWLPQPEGWGDFAAAHQDDDPASMLSLYRELSAARRAHAISQGSDPRIVDLDERLVTVVRGGLIVILNPTNGPVQLDVTHAELEGARPVLSSCPEEMHTPGVLPADTTIWLVR